MVKRFEDAFAAVSGTKHAIAVNNGTTALVAALQVLDLKPGDEVITSPFTFVATLNAILEAGATVRFADIRRDDFAIDPDAVAKAVTDRTKVLMPVHLYGQTADMGKLAPLAAEHGLQVIEDSAQAVGASFEGKQAGSFGIGCFSLYATKNITTAEGGVITTDDDALADKLRVLRNQGMRARYQYEVAGHNYRMTDLHAAVGIPQLAKLDQLTAARQANAKASRARRASRSRRCCRAASTCGTSTRCWSGRTRSSRATSSPRRSPNAASATASTTRRSCSTTTATRVTT